MSGLLRLWGLSKLDLRNMGSLGQMLQSEYEMSSTDLCLNTCSVALGMNFGSRGDQLMEASGALKLGLSGI